MNRNLRSLAIALALGLLVIPASAQKVTKVGTTAAKFLSIPVGARALGMGGAFVGVASDASAMFWNPAGMARAKQAEVLVNHAEWLADIDFNWGGVMMPLGDLGTVGVSVTSLSMAEMERTTEEQPDGTGQTFSAGSFALGLSYAKNLTDWFSIGGTARYVNEHIWNSNATGFAVDIGTLFTTPFDGLTFGAGISNFGTKLQMSGDDLLVQKDISPNNGNNANVNANLSTESFDLPLTLRIGVAYQALENEDQSLILAVDAAHPNDNAEYLNLGIEYAFFQRIVWLRGGYKAIGATDSEEKFTVGGGVRYGLTSDLVFRLDYAFERFGRLSNVHKFSVALMY
ncbi:MAG: PorV/PorQ family protein [Bacteroidetes bacterium]|nr:PorV/PorQ family protein [Bacteroidota bacterium]